MDKTILLFTSVGCDHCNDQADILSQTVNIHGMPIAEMDVGKHPELAKKYCISLVPTTLVVDSSGQGIKVITGVHSLESLTEKLSNI